MELARLRAEIARLRMERDIAATREHVHFQVCVVDGVFKEVAREADADGRATTPDIIFHSATGMDAAGVAVIQDTLREYILRTFVGRGLLENFQAKKCWSASTRL
jgi:Putative transposase